MKGGREGEWVGAHGHLVAQCKDSSCSKAVFCGDHVFDPRESIALFHASGRNVLWGVPLFFSTGPCRWDSSSDKASSFRGRTDLVLGLRARTDLEGLPEAT